MSELRDIRLLIARQLDASRNVKLALMDVLNIFDSALDAEGWQPPRELTDAIRRLDRAVIDDDEPHETDDDLLDEDEDEDDVEYVDLDDIEEMVDDASEDDDEED